MATSSAPAKVFIAGEHAVVYGEPALLAAVDLRARVTVETSTGEGDDIPNSPYVRRAVEKVRAELDDTTQLDVSVDSEIPVGAGLGSSAAVTVATVDATARELGGGFDAEDVARVGHAVECDVQGEASPSDTYASAKGGFVRVEGEDRRSVEAPPTEFVIGHDGGSSPTGEMVERVSQLVDENTVAEDVVASIGDLTDLAVESVEQDDFEKTAELMNMNHGLLEALGVSASSLSRAVWSARDAGGGAKLTGAGGAGCIVAHPPTDEVYEAVVDATQSAWRLGVAEGVRPE